MIACDVNVLVNADNRDAHRHEQYRSWLEDAVNGGEPFGLSSVVGGRFLRVVTPPKVLERPLSTPEAVALLDALSAGRAVVPLEPGQRHWSIFLDLCRATEARGNAIPDAYLAALAVERDCRWYSADRGFARYPGLRSGHPLDSGAHA